MNSNRKMSAIPGSERQPVRGARFIHNSHPDQTIEVSVRIRSKAEAQRAELKSSLEKPGFKHMSRQEFESAHGADPADVEQIKKFEIVQGDWLPGGDELTPTMKLKRKPIAAKYAAEIDAMYAS